MQTGILAFRSDRANFFQRAWDRLRLTPRTPIDLAETNLRLERVEGVAQRLSALLAGGERDNLVQNQLQNLPPELAQYQLMRVPGIGNAKASALLERFGSLAAIRHASVEEIEAQVPGIGITLAERVKEHLKRL